MSRTVLRSVNVLDGRNEAVPNQTIVIDGDRISEIGGVVETQVGDDIHELAGRTVMPGMVAGHFHSCFHNFGGLPGPYGSEHPPSYAAVKSLTNLQLALSHGYTSVVSAGAPFDVEPGVNQAIEEGYVVGPRMIPCARELGTTGFQEDVVPWYWHAQDGGLYQTVDGPDAFRFAVRDAVRRGAQMIKLYATRGHGSSSDKNALEIDPDELKAAIETAHNRGVLVRAHAAYKRGIMLCIELGIDIIDHCDDIDDEIIEAMAEHDTVLVPSLHWPSTLRAMPNFETSEMGQAIERMRVGLPKAQAAGIRICLGDDYGAVGFPHGTYGEELKVYVDDFRFDPLTVISWGTCNGAAMMRREADLGTLEVGKLADLLVLADDPSRDIRALADVRPLCVVKGGVPVVGTYTAHTAAVRVGPATGGAEALGDSLPWANSATAVGDVLPKLAGMS